MADPCHSCPIYEEGVSCPAKWGFKLCVEHRKANRTDAQKRFDEREHDYVEPSGARRGDLPGWRNRKR